MTAFVGTILWALVLRVIWGYIGLRVINGLGVTLGVYWGYNGKYNGNHYFGFRV